MVEQFEKRGGNAGEVLDGGGEGGEVGVMVLEKVGLALVFYLGVHV